MRTRALHRLRLGLVLLSGLGALAAGATSPPKPPTQKEYTSPGGRFRLELLSSLAVLEKTEQKPRAEGGTVEVSYRAGTSQQLVTTREKDAQGQLTAVKLDLRLFDALGTALSLFDTQEGPAAAPRWTTVVGYLPHEILVSDSGRYVATIDHWQNWGHTRDVVVLLGPEGKVLWRLALKDFVSEKEISRMKVTETGILWTYSLGAHSHEFREEDGVLVLKVAKYHWLPSLFEPELVEKRISLETGKVVP
jgi:hypothetical protein